MLTLPGSAFAAAGQAGPADEVRLITLDPGHFRAPAGRPTSAAQINAHGLRMAREGSRFAMSSPTNSSFAGSQRSFRPSNIAI
jgi:hypothetical protein